MTAHIPKNAQSNGLNQRHAACLHFSFPMTYKYNQKCERAMKKAIISNNQISRYSSTTKTKKKPCKSLAR